MKPPHKGSIWRAMLIGPAPGCPGQQMTTDLEDVDARPARSRIAERWILEQIAAHWIQPINGSQKSPERGLYLYWQNGPDNQPIRTIRFERRTTCVTTGET